MKPTYDDWRAQVEKELAGAPFEKLVTRAEGLEIQPLYTERVDSGVPGVAPFVRGATATAAPFELCMRSGDSEAIEDDLAGGTDALWFAEGDRKALEAALGHDLAVVMDIAGTPKIEHFKAVMKARRAWLGVDPIGELWASELEASAVPRQLNEVAAFARRVAEQRTSGMLGAPGHEVRAVRISSVGFHAAGADAADELALILASGVAYLRALVQEGLDDAAAARSLWVQIAVGRDTFGELCKLRALRLVWWKLLAAAGVTDLGLDAIHAVCSPRTQSVRDPSVNMLRVTTEVFAAVLGGAQLVTPAAFDAAFGTPSALGRRTARNTALVLREESHLGRVLDAGGGSYYLEARTATLAREAWSRFQAIERDGGIVVAIKAGSLRQRLDAAWHVRAAAIAVRKEPVLGTSEFANPREKLPAALPEVNGPGHRDGEAFEALRARVEGSREVVLVTLGPASEYRGRLGYAQAFFATAGLATREDGEHTPQAPDQIACICGSDERYATEAAACATKLRAAGWAHVVLAGRPGALEKPLKAAGVDRFIFVGCDVIATLNALTGGAA
ncbi:methylmalonyl-CoA mutase family protein [soil metagenome]